MRGAITDDRFVELPEQILENVALFGPRLGLLTLGRRRVGLGIEELEQAWPQAPAIEDPPQRPQVWPQCRIAAQRRGVGARDVGFVRDAALGVHRQLVLEHRGVLLARLTLELALVGGGAIARGLVARPAGDQVDRIGSPRQAFVLGEDRLGVQDLDHVGAAVGPAPNLVGIGVERHLGLVERGNYRVRVVGGSAAHHARRGGLGVILLHQIRRAIGGGHARF